MNGYPQWLLGLADFFARKYYRAGIERDDLLQEAMLAVILARKRLWHTSTDGGFLWIRARWSMVDWARKQTKGKSVSLSYTVRDQRDSFRDIDARIDFDRFLCRLPLRSRKILRCKVDGVSYKEIGKRFGISPSRITQIIFYESRHYAAMRPSQ